MINVLVCGGRGFLDRKKAYRVLDRLHAEAAFDSVIEGGALGADRLAREWATERGIKVSTYPANWTEHGKAAGPIRNSRMLTEGKPDMVIAFPGGKGTADMVKKARAKMVPVEVIE